MKEKGQTRYKSKFPAGLSKLILFCLIMALLLFVLFMTCSLKHVTIVGSTHYSDQELKKRVITKKTDRNTLLLYLRYKYGRTDSIPFIQDIDIEMLDRNSIKIHVYEKVVTGCIEFMGGYMYFDKDGIVVESSDEKLDKVPVITGLKFSKIVLYQKLKVQKDSLFDVILNITQLIDKYELDVDTIQFNSDLEVILYCGNIKVLLGKRDTYDEQIAELKNLLPSAGNKNITLDMTDYQEGQEKIFARPSD